VIGLPALVLNIVVTVLVSLVTRPPDPAAIAAGMGTEVVGTRSAVPVAEPN
jgi:hypothetical protein